MYNRAMGFVSLLAVVGVSIVFGMVLGGKLNAPQYALAAPEASPLRLAPAVGSVSGTGDFADIVEQSMPAVVSVTSTQLGSGETEEGEQQAPPQDQFWRFFFGPDGGSPDQRQMPRNHPHIGEGSGFIISADGYILTNNHVVENADRIQIGMNDGKRYDAVVIGTDPSIDLALIKVEPEGSLPTLPLGDSANLRVGEWVIAIGNPLEYEQTVTVGVVSAKKRRVPIGTTDTGVVSFIQTDAAINFGNSGGPLLDAGGNVVGINTAIRRANFAEGIGFALPINQARNVMEQLREYGQVRRGYIGITMNQGGLDEAARDYYGLPDTLGVIVDEVADEGPAEQAGLRGGDVIRQVDGEQVRDNMDLIGKIAAHQPGDDVSLEVFRDGKVLKFNATLVDRDEQLEELRTRGGGQPNSGLREDDEQEADRLGMTVKTLTSRMRDDLGMEGRQSGVIVTEVEFGSLAAEKNIVANMVVTAVNGKSIGSVDDFTAALDAVGPGEPVKLDLLAGTRNVSVFLKMPK